MLSNPMRKKNVNETLFINSSFGTGGFSFAMSDKWEPRLCHLIPDRNNYEHTQI